MTEVVGERFTCRVNPLERRALYADRCVLIVAALDLLVKRERHPLTVAAVGADAAALDRPPLLITARHQTIAGGMVAPAAEGVSIIQLMELADLGALLNGLEPPPLLAVLAHGHLVLVDVERDVLCGGVLPCLLLWNGVLLAVGDLERLAHPVRHIMGTPSRTCARRDGAGCHRFRSEDAPSPCLLHDLRLPYAILRVDCKLSVHDTAFRLQRTMECELANTLCAAAFPLVEVGEVVHATE